MSESPFIPPNNPNRPAPVKQPPPARRAPVVVLNKTIQRMPKPAALAEHHFVMGKRSYSSLVELVDDLIARRGMKPKRCNKYRDLRESLVSVEDVNEV